MEKFQIAKYGMVQVTALVYAMLCCGTAVKMCKWRIEHGLPMWTGNLYSGALFFRDYGIFFFLIILAWVAATAYYTSGLSKHDMDEGWLGIAGALILIFFVLFGTFFGIGTALQTFTRYS